MAVKDESLHHATESLILPTPRRYYPAKIHTTHWQLRSLISSPTGNNVYFPSGRYVIRLNTQTKEREVITTLSFSPRCLTATKGWICCGGEKGEYTAIPLDEEEDVDDREGSLLHEFNEGLSSDPDARLPLDLGRSVPLSRHTAIIRRIRGFNNSTASPVKIIGTEIVNCITIWVPPSKSLNETYQIPVAVIANNDRTVCIMDLQESEVLEKLSFPDNVNRALMSPDGRILVAICDDPFMYVHTRRKTEVIPKGSSAKDESPMGPEWILWGKFQLKGQREADKSSMRGSFAAAFSRSGAYLAVATQYGIISIFDTSSLLREDSDPLVTHFTSSRPTDSTTVTNPVRAVRAMEFSPEPFDLLAWTEASGRVGVADVRNLFYSRQSIKLDSHGDGVERISVMDRAIETLEPLIDPRLRVSRSETPTGSTPDYLGLDFERRQFRNLSRQMFDRNQSPLTPEEMQVLEAHQLARRERDALRDAQAEVASILPTEARTGAAHASMAWTDDITPGSASTGLPITERSSAVERSTAGLPSSLRDFVNTDRSAASFRAFINERNQDRERRAQAQTPRQRTSVFLDAAQMELDRLTNARNELIARVPRAHNSSLGAGPILRSPHDQLNAARTRLGIPTVNASDDTEALSLERLRIDPIYNLLMPEPERARLEQMPIGTHRTEISTADPIDRPTETSTGRTLNPDTQVETDDDVQRAFAHRLRQPFRPSDEMAAAYAINEFGNSYSGSAYSRRASTRLGGSVETMGCCWSENGRIL
ncbi:hypothetical protein PVAG01_01880 [Phlyctema vagabunda]|uniref:DUF2415 domain-containing protein n=1 Tax=Phlyctema vagabunda TaxID=108571 RepID=A0ABR4PYF4_9HELO